MSIAEDTIASLSLQLRACESLLDDERKAHAATRAAAIDEAARVPREFYDDIEQFSCEHGCEENYLKIEGRIRALETREQLRLPVATDGKRA